MLDQCHNIEAEDPRPDPLGAQRPGDDGPGAARRPRRRWREAERAGDVLAGNAVLMDAFYTDVRADLADWRAARGLPADPMDAYRRSGYAERIVAERVGGQPGRLGRVSHPAVERAARPLATGSAPTAATRTTPAATRRRRASTSTRPPATDVELLWVKGSGGDLGTLTEPGLAVLRLDRLRALVDVYPGEDREDEMVAAFDFCLHGRGGAAPSIDTAMHGLVDAAHVDHLHPDSGIAIATAADGEQLTKDIYGDKVVWVPWRRPGFQLGLDIAAVHAGQPAGRRRASSAATASRPGAPPATRPRPTRRWIIEHGRGPTSTRTATRTRSAPSSTIAGHSPRLSGGRRRRRWRRTCGPSPRTITAWSATSPTATWCSTSSPARSCPPSPSSARRAPTTSCARRSSRSCSTCPPTASVEDCVARLGELHERYRADYRRLLRAPRHAGLAADAGRRPGDHPRARRRDVLLRQGQADGPGRRRVLRQRHQRHARRRGASRPTPRSPSARSSASSTGRSRRRSSSRLPEAEAPRRAHRPGHRRGQRHRQGHRHPARGRGRLRRHRRPRRRPPRRRPRPSSAGPTSRSASPPTSPTRTPSAPPSTPRSSPSAASTSSSTTPGCRSPSRCSRRPRRTGTSSTT